MTPFRKRYNFLVPFNQMQNKWLFRDTRTFLQWTVIVPLYCVESLDINVRGSLTSKSNWAHLDSILRWFDSSFDLSFQNLDFPAAVIWSRHRFNEQHASRDCPSKPAVSQNQSFQGSRFSSNGVINYKSYTICNLRRWKKISGSNLPFILPCEVSPTNKNGRIFELSILSFDWSLDCQNVTSNFSSSSFVITSFSFCVKFLWPH